MLLKATPPLLPHLAGSQDDNGNAGKRPLRILIRRRHVLAEDFDVILERAKEHWRFATDSGHLTLRHAENEVA